MAYLWSASAYPGNADSVFIAGFGPGYVDPGDAYGGCGLGFGVRCLMN
jgi:hypothetical protein